MSTLDDPRAILEDVAGLLAHLDRLGLEPAADARFVRVRERVDAYLHPYQPVDFVVSDSGENSRNVGTVLPDGTYVHGLPDPQPAADVTSKAELDEFDGVTVVHGLPTGDHRAGPPPLRFLYVGNFGPDHSTENELAKAIVDAGHEVVTVQEDDRGMWERFGSGAELPGGGLPPDVFLWTRTGWNWTDRGWNPMSAAQAQLDGLAFLRDLGVPSVGYHLDRWWGLDREHQVTFEPFFRCDLVVTADGGHDDDWARAGVEHAWLPPAVSRFECEPGVARSRYTSDIAFVGSWRPGYHPEWPHRRELVDHLRSRWGKRCKFWPEPGAHAVRGPALRDLYASVAVVVGDSCLAGGATRYMSDRVPETLGRGGFLLHPAVEGVTDGTLYTDRVHLVTWPLGDWDSLDAAIDHYLKHPAERDAIARAGRDHVLTHHTYTVRVRQLVGMLAATTGLGM